MKKTNFLFVLTDDQSYWALGKETSCIISPTLDNLADNGAYYKNFFCACPVCSPARASILTGLMPSTHGIQDWIISGNLNIKDMPKFVQERPPIKNNEIVAYDYLEKYTTYTDVLADNGYNIALSGKWHMGDTLKKRKGYVYWNSLLRGGCSYMSYDLYKDGEVTSHTDYLTDKITDNAIDFLENYDSEKPFYLGVHYTAPHTPWDKEEHKEDLWKLYDGADFSAVENEKMHEDLVLHKYIGDTKEKREEWLKGYFSAITGVDQSLKRIMDALEAKGELENTVIIFTGDNGFCLGHHGIWGKGNGTYPQNMYEESIKVPYIMYNKSKIQPKVVNSLCSHVDVFPTILEMAGINPPQIKGQWGKSLVGDDEKIDSNHVVVFDEYGAVRMVRDERYKFIKNYKTGEEILFDLVSDPRERTNIINNEEHSERISSMRNVLERDFEEYTTEDCDSRIQDNCGLGQLKMVNKFAENETFLNNLVFYRDKK